MLKTTELSALLVCPDRALAQEFSSAIAELKNLNILVDFKEYPTPGMLDERIKHLNPDALFVDVGAERESALLLLSQVTAAYPALAVVGLSGSSDPETILLCLRRGVAEFLHAPFRLSEAEQALVRLVRRKELDARNQPARGKLLAFAPCKGGSGSSTIAANTAHMLSRMGKRILLADFDLVAGTIAFLFKLTHSYSLLDAIKHSHQLDESLWASLVSNRGSMDILPAPDKPYTAPIEPYRVHECLEYARSIYEYVIVDLPGVSDKVSLATLNRADQILVVANPELPTLFLARRTLALLEEFGFHKEQLRVLLNRLHKHEELTLNDMEKIFRYPIHVTFPNDYPTIRRALTEGKPVSDSCELGVAYRKFAEGMAGVTKTGRKKGALVGFKTLFSET